MQNGYDGQWTPEQIAAWQAAQLGMTPEQYAAWQAQQSGQWTPDQYAAWQAQQQGAQMTPEQYAAWQAQQMWTPPEPSMQPPQAGMSQEEAMQYQLGMTPEQVRQWKKAKKAAKKAGKAKKHGGFRRTLRILLIVAVLGAGGWYAWQQMRSSAPTTATIQLGTLGTTYRGDALIVRDETVYDDESVQSIEYVAEEGSTVYRGDVVCYVYSTGYSSREMSTLQDYRDQIKDYQRTLLQTETAYDQKMTRLENEVVQRGLEVRSLVQGARGNLTNQEKILDTAITQRQAYFKSKYSSDMRLNRLFDDENTQQQRIDSWIKQRAATEESIISFYTDGFEYALSASRYDQYTPSQVRAMINGEKPATSTASRGRTDIYRLIKKTNYVVLLLVRDSTWNPVEGTTYKLRLEQFSNTLVNAQVLSFTRASGELLVRLAVMGDVTPVLYMRTCQAELGEYADSLIVPAAAVVDRKDAQGETRQGVVLMQDDQQYFVPVNIISQTGDQVYISAIQTGVLSEGQTVRLFR